MKTNALVLIGIILLMGCVSPRTAAYKSLATIGYSADAAVKAFVEAEGKGLITKAQHDQVAQILDNEYGPAYEAAVTAAHMDLTTAAPAEVVALAQKLLTVIDTILTKKKL